MFRLSFCLLYRMLQLGQTNFLFDLMPRSTAFRRMEGWVAGTCNNICRKESWVLQSQKQKIEKKGKRKRRDSTMVQSRGWRTWTHVIWQRNGVIIQVCKVSWMMQHMRLLLHSCTSDMLWCDVVSHGQKYGWTLWSCDHFGLTACLNDRRYQLSKPCCRRVCNILDCGDHHLI